MSLLLLPLHSANCPKGQQQQQSLRKPLQGTTPQRQWLTATGKGTPYLISYVYANISKLCMPPSRGWKRRGEETIFPRGEALWSRNPVKVTFLRNNDRSFGWLLQTSWTRAGRDRGGKFSVRLCGEICWREAGCWLTCRLVSGGNVPFITCVR